MATDKDYEIWGDIVEELRGTAGFPIPEEFENNKEFLDYLGQWIFICETCGWWCERSEESEDPSHYGSCIECHPEDSED